MNRRLLGCLSALLLLVGTARADGPAADVRTFQYQPVEGAFRSVNGTNRFTRALYGGPTAFRLETSDRPEFAFWLPGMGGHVSAFVSCADGLHALADLSVVSDYTPGSRTYRVDSYEHDIHLLLTAVVPPDHESAVWRTTNLSSHPVALSFRYGGASGKRFSRNGDMGADPADCFFLKPSYCLGNDYRLSPAGFSITFAQGSKHGALTMQGLFPADATLSVVPLDGHPEAPVVMATFAVPAGADAYCCIGREVPADAAALVAWYADGEALGRSYAHRLVVDTPDPYLNLVGGALVAAADGIWDGQTFLHGAVGWRMPLAGWRAAYAGDCLGWHDRARTHFDAYAASQVTDVPPVYPHPAQDSTLRLARAAKRWGTPMYSDGYICRNPGRNDQMHHYDMNLNYVDELLCHLQWTGDWDYARRMFPLLERHLAWEKRNFDPDDDGLYDSYCCIWASDGLYYNGGAGTHSTALNLRALRLAALIADGVGEPARADYYRAEADKTSRALQDSLWNPQQGVWGEYRDLMGLGRLHPYPALWTVYHAIDAEVGTAAQRLSATRYVDDCIPHIPIVAAAGEGAEPMVVGQQLSTSCWQPYGWSINNVAFAESMNMALAYWQAGRPDDGYRLFRSNILDGMYLGHSPGNVGQISHYDVARAECYRDFGDPVGVASRALVEGLMGVVPERLQHRIVVRPGFPSHWDHATLATPDVRLSYTRHGRRATYRVTLSDTFTADTLVLRLPGQHDRKTLTRGRSEFRFRVRTSRRKSSADPLTPSPVDTLRPLLPAGQQSTAFTAVDTTALEPVAIPYNDSLTNLFTPRYLSPRPDRTTLQIPTNGIGEWCHPVTEFAIDDSALRADTLLVTPFGVPFCTCPEGDNVLFATRWDNFPTRVSVPLTGCATHLYLLLAGTTNAMQSHIANGVVRVRYADGPADSLLLVTPYTWCPIEQDYYDDGLAFDLRGCRPWRLMLRDGRVSRILSATAAAAVHAQQYTAATPVTLDTNTTGHFGNTLPGGAAILLDIPLDGRRPLAALEVECLSNDILIGLLAATLQRDRGVTELRM